MNRDLKWVWPSSDSSLQIQNQYSRWICIFWPEILVKKSCGISYINCLGNDLNRDLSWVWSSSGSWHEIQKSIFLRNIHFCIPEEHSFFSSSGSWHEIQNQYSWGTFIFVLWKSIWWSKLYQFGWDFRDKAQPSNAFMC